MLEGFVPPAPETALAVGGSARALRVDRRAACSARTSSTRSPAILARTPARRDHRALRRPRRSGADAGGRRRDPRGDLQSALARPAPGRPRRRRPRGRGDRARLPARSRLRRAARFLRPPRPRNHPAAIGRLGSERSACNRRSSRSPRAPAPRDRAHEPRRPRGRRIPSDLHRFRVATRRSRSLIRASRPLIRDQLAGVDRELRWLGGVSGPRSATSTS